MSEIIKALKSGYQLWRKTWLTQALVGLVFWIGAVLIILPFVFLLVISLSSIPPVFDLNTPIIISILQTFAANPVLWLSLIAIAVLLVVINTQIMGVIQLITHRHIQNDPINTEQVFNLFLPKMLPLTLLAIIEVLTLAVPTWLIGEILRPFLASDLYPAITILPLYFGALSLNIVDIIWILMFFIILVGTGAPYYIATAAIISDEAGVSGIIDAWKTYLKKLSSLIPAMIILLLIGFGIAIGLSIPIAGIVLSSGNLPMLYLSIYAVVIVSFVMALIVGNWFYTSIYSYLHNTK
jgi:hypothetical protein